MKLVAASLLSILLLAACGGEPTNEAAPPVPEAKVVEEPVPLPPAAVTPAEAPALLVGKWVSIDDAKSTIDVTADGKWLSKYEGPEAMNEASTWKVFTKEDALPEAKDQALEAGKAYLVVTASDGPFFYELGIVTADSLEMYYLARGNRLAFTRTP